MPPKKYYKKTLVNNATKKSIEKIDLDIGVGSENKAKWLIIVESPSKCAKIEHYLGNDYKCIASKGHFREIGGLTKINTKSNFHPTFDIIAEKKDHVEKMRAIIRQYSWQEILLATDDDREGEAIAWHICQTFHLPVTDIARITFHEVTQVAILESVRNPGKINMSMVYAQHARQILDIIVGFKISPLLWKNIHRGKTALSAGRCQTPALRLVYDNEQLRKSGSGSVETRYKTVGHFFPGFDPVSGIPFELNREFDSSDEMREFLDNCAGSPGGKGDKKLQLSIGEPKESRRSPPKPFNTSRLLQVASNQLRYSPKQTMQICQTLYQNGHITYMRTENTKYAPAFLETMRRFITKEYGSDGTDGGFIGNLAALSNGGGVDSAVQNSTDAANPHEAIRVTNINTRSLPDDGREATLYKLIWQNTVESCMSDAIYSVSVAKITAPQDLHFSHTLEIPKFLGWRRVWSKNQGQDQDKESAKLLYLRGLLNATQKMNAPPSPYLYIESAVVVRNNILHYTEASLIQKLEDLGIGRPSTFAMLVETIQERGYVKYMDVPGREIKCQEFKLYPDVLESIESIKTFGQEKGKLVIRPIGILAIEFLIQHFENLFSYDYTKKMETDLDRILALGPEDAEVRWPELCKSCYTEIGVSTKRLSESTTKPRYWIDDDHELLIQPFGASIRKVDQETGKTSYLPVKPGFEIDMERLGRGEYVVADLAAFESEFLGQYEGLDVTVHIGKYGPYIKWGDQNRGLGVDFSFNDGVLLDDIIPFLSPQDSSKIENIEGGDGDGDKTMRKPPQIKNAAVLRPINSDMSVRSGKFGPYIFYKTSEMKKPKFISLGKKFKGDPLTCELNKLVEFANA